MPDFNRKVIVNTLSLASVISSLNIYTIKNILVDKRDMVLVWNNYLSIHVKLVTTPIFNFS